MDFNYCPILGLRYTSNWVFLDTKISWDKTSESAYDAGKVNLYLIDEAGHWPRTNNLEDYWNKITTNIV